MFIVLLLKSKLCLILLLHSMTQINNAICVCIVYITRSSWSTTQSKYTYIKNCTLHANYTRFVPIHTSKSIHFFFILAQVVFQCSVYSTWMYLYFCFYRAYGYNMQHFNVMSFAIRDSKLSLQLQRQKSFFAKKILQLDYCQHYRTRLVTEKTQISL